MTKHNAVTTEQIQWLLERINTSSDPITREQVRTFGRHPGGPILPNAMLAVVRLPEVFGTLTDGSRAKNRADSLAVSPTGDLWLTTIIEGRSGLVQVPHPADRGPQFTNQFTFLVADQPGACFRARIIGFRPDGLPVVEVFVCAASSTSKYHGAGSKFFVGGLEQKFVDLLPTNYTALCVAPDGALLTLHENVTAHGRYSVWRNGECILRMDSYAQDVFVLDDGVIVTTQSSRDGCSLYQWTAPGIFSDPPRRVADAKYGDISFGGRIVQARGRIGDLRLTIGADARNVVITRYTNPDNPEDGTVTHCLGDCPYIGNDAVLPDGRTVYVGQAYRDELQCLVVDGVPQEPFKLVTGVVPCGDSYRYFGITGRHCCMMDLPPPALRGAEGRIAAA